LYERLHDSASQKDLLKRSADLHATILRVCTSSQAPGATAPIFVSATDGINPIYADVPPGSLLKLPALGFIGEGDPLFVQTYRWLHSSDYTFSNADQPYGLPGSYRLPFTTSWSVADHLRLKAGRELAAKILLESAWDGGIISEGVDSRTGIADNDGRAFATAAGYVAHAICETFCTDSQPPK
jgi:meiotically up-regulated gene 157 (Mug157) protein